MAQQYEAEQKQGYCERQEKRYSRMSKYSLDPDNQRMYGARAKEWGEKAGEFEKLADSIPTPDKKSVETVEKADGSGIIKSVELPSEINEITSMAEKTKRQISEAIDDMLNEYDIRLSKLSVEALSDEYNKVPFQYQSYFENDILKHKLVINSNYYFNDSHEEFQARILRNYNNGVLASKSVKDLISHELAHVMTFQDTDSQGTLLLRNKQLMKKCIPGVSKYADYSMDGAETIAEGFVRIRNGESVPKDVRSLIKEYIGRWKK